MRAKGQNTMSTRRAVRPDAGVYRQTRRIGRRRRSTSLTIAYAGIVLMIFAVLVVWWLIAHHA
ncbi:MAG: hypothetical protein JO353_07885 [Phycisphaerae bacterium]|nr:hypothetical protein [Phycisphaerae bacterium]